MGYSDQPDIDGGNGSLEIPEFRSDHDDGSSFSPADIDDSEYGYVPPQPTSLRRGCASRCKVYLVACLLVAALGFAVYEYSSQGAGSSSSGGSRGHDIGKPLFLGNKKHNSKEADWDVDAAAEALAEGTVRDKDTTNPEDEYIAEYKTEQSEMEALESQPARPVPSASSSIHSSSSTVDSSVQPCEDDPTFVHNNLKSCSNWVEHVGRKPLRQARCADKTGIIDDRGNELLLKNFCRKSCGVCDEANATPAQKEENEYVQELEQLEEEGKVEEKGLYDTDEPDDDVTKMEDEVKIQEEDGKLWEELKDEENEEEEEEFGEDFVSEGKSHEVPLPPDVEHRVPDYFVPLTPLERDAMKEKLRGVLRTTKDALLKTSHSSSIPEDLRGLTIPSQRTLVLSPHKAKLFMHLRHYMTGDDEIDTLVNCALDRQEELHDGLELVYSSIGEDDNLQLCMSDMASRLGATLVDNEFYQNGEDGKPKTDQPPFDPADESLQIPLESRNACQSSDANIMSYGANLKTVETFGWDNVDSIAMFANPVERTHRWYQLMAQDCYSCKEFSEVLREIKSGKFTSDLDICTSQLIGHQATNLLTSPELIKIANDVTFPREEEIVNEAVRNLREKITWIGVLDRIPDSMIGFKEVFPWLADNLTGQSYILQKEFEARHDEMGDDARFALPEDYIDKKSCLFKHTNEIPYTCGSKEVNGNALTWISQLNMRDLAVYRAALERYEIQNELLAEYRSALNMNDGS